MKIAILSPVAWRTPPRKYGPWEQVASNLTEGLVKKGVNVTLFATGDSVTSAKLKWMCQKGYEETEGADAKVFECMHISYLMEHAHEFDLIHNHFDFLPLTYSRLVDTPFVTTIHGFSSPKIIPVFKRYNDRSAYISISNSDRSPELNYAATVYNGIVTDDFPYYPDHGKYLLYFGRIHHDKGTFEAIEIALKTDYNLIIAGLIQDTEYFDYKVKPFVDDKKIIYAGHAGPEERKKLMGEAMVLLHPINFSEPFGLSVAEAMLCGCPVIAFNKGSMPELIDDGKSGFLVDDIDTAVEVIPKLNTIDRSYCRKWSESRFSVEKMTEGYLKVYERILSSKFKV